MKKRVALVLGSGGARGYAHIGVIEEIEKRGYEIACIAGCSMGAVVGGIYAAGKLQDYRNWIESLDYLDVLRLVDVSFRLGAIRGEKVFGQIRKIVGEINIEDLRIPYTAVATDLTNQQEIWFQEGCLHQAMRASAAIPSLFTPVMQGNRMLVDGGLLNPLPIVPVVSSHCDLIIAVNLNATNQKHYTLPVIQRPPAFKSRFDNLVRSLGSHLPFRRKQAEQLLLLEQEALQAQAADINPLARRCRAGSPATGRSPGNRWRPQVGNRFVHHRQRRAGVAAGFDQPEFRGDADVVGPVQNCRLPAGCADQRTQARVPVLRVLQGAGIDRAGAGDCQ